MDNPVNIISCSSMQLEIGDEFQLAAVNVYGHSIIWSSSDESIAAVTQDGLVKVKRSGTVTITAESENALPVTCIINVLKKKQTVSWRQSFNNIYVGDDIELMASASSGLAVEYVITQGSGCAEMSDVKLVCKAAGEVTIEARQQGDDEYEAAESVSKTIVIKKRQQSIAWEQSFDDIKVGDEIELMASASSGLTVEYVITQGSGCAEISDGKLVCKAAGEVTVEARQQGNDKYEAAESVSKTVCILSAEITFPVTIDGVTYDYCDGSTEELCVTGSTAETIIIKEEVNGIPVTAIKSQSFRGEQKP